LTGNIETRLRKLELEAEQEMSAPQIIILYHDKDEDLETILAANSLTTTERDLVISLARGSGERRPLDQRIISAHGKAA
jgi:hypothetical protein